MRTLLTAAVVLAVISGGPAVLPATAAKTASIDGLARRECRQDLRRDRRDFREDYGGTGRTAMARCVREHKREAAQECRAALRESRADFRDEFGGTDARAMRRCIRDELR
jgi:hypothetical protein